MAAYKILSRYVWNLLAMWGHGQSEVCVISISVTLKRNHLFFCVCCFCFIDQTYCDRLRQDTAFLTSNGRLSEQLVDKIILQLNRVYPQILTIKEAEKVIKRK